MKKLLSIFLAAGTLGSCKLPLTEEQLSYLEIADIGDSLIFCCDPYHCDTLIISEKEIYYENLNPFFGNTLYRPQVAALIFDRPQEKKRLRSTLIQIWGRPTPADSTRIVVSLFYDHWFLSTTRNDLGLPYNKTISFNGDQYDSNYLRLDDSPEVNHEDSSALRSLIWNRSVGPLEYLDIHDRTWKRIK